MKSSTWRVYVTHNESYHIYMCVCVSQKSILSLVPRGQFISMLSSSDAANLLSPKEKKTVKTKSSLSIDASSLALSLYIHTRERKEGCLACFACLYVRSSSCYLLLAI